MAACGGEKRSERYAKGRGERRKPLLGRRRKVRALPVEAVRRREPGHLALGQLGAGRADRSRGRSSALAVGGNGTAHVGGRQDMLSFYGPYLIAYLHEGRPVGNHHKRDAPAKM